MSSSTSSSPTIPPSPSSTKSTLSPDLDTSQRTIQHWKDRAQDRGRRVNVLERKNAELEVRVEELESMLASTRVTSAKLWAENEALCKERDLVRCTLIGAKARARAEAGSQRPQGKDGVGDEPCQGTSEVGDGLPIEEAPSCELREFARTGATVSQAGEDDGWVEDRVEVMKELLQALVVSCMEEHDARGEDILSPDFKMVCSAGSFELEHGVSRSVDDENKGKDEPVVCTAEISLEGSSGIDHILLKTKIHL